MKMLNELMKTRKYERQTIYYIVEFAIKMDWNGNTGVWNVDRPRCVGPGPPELQTEIVRIISVHVSQLGKGEVIFS